MLETALLMKLGQFTIKIKEKRKEYMAKLLLMRLRSYWKKELKLKSYRG